LASPQCLAGESPSLRPTLGSQGCFPHGLRVNLNLPWSTPGQRKLTRVMSHRVFSKHPHETDCKLTATGIIEPPTSIGQVVKIIVHRPAVAGLMLDELGHNAPQ